MGNFCSCCEELLVEDELPPIVFFDLEDLKNLGTTPRSPEDKHLHRKYDDIDKDNSVFIFVSHCWKRGYKGAPGYDGRPHPDTPNNDKLKLTIQACEKWKKSYELLSTFNVELKKLEQRKTYLQEMQELFELNKTEYKEIQKARRELEFLKACWDRQGPVPREGRLCPCCRGHARGCVLCGDG